MPEIIYTEFKDYLVDFKSKPDCVLDNGSTVELHGFCDASEKAYGTCVYLWAVNISEVVVHLVCAKSRVTSLKIISLPRLELYGALLLSELVEKVRTSSRIRFENETN